LEQNLPYYYFERSGCFSEAIGWGSAPFILNFNRNSFSHKTLKELRMICKYFFRNIRHDFKEHLRSINTDIKFKHFLYDKDTLELVDLEKSSIGSIESELADLLYNYWYTTDRDCALSELLSFLPEEIDVRKVISHMAHICFYDIQVNTVMHGSIPDFEYGRLWMLFQAAKALPPRNNISRPS